MILKILLNIQESEEGEVKKIEGLSFIITNVSKLNEKDYFLPTTIVESPNF